MPRILLGLTRSWRHCLIWIDEAQVLLGWDLYTANALVMNHTFRYLDSMMNSLKGEHSSLPSNNGY